MFFSVNEAALPFRELPSDTQVRGLSWVMVPFLKTK